MAARRGRRPLGRPGCLRWERPRCTVQHRERRALRCAPLPAAFRVGRWGSPSGAVAGAVEKGTAHHITLKMLQSDEVAEEEDGSPALMGLIIKGYLCLSVCCSVCCVVGSVLLLVLGGQCFFGGSGEEEAGDGGGGCGAGSVAMVVLGSAPPLAALSAVLYLQADARGWFRPAHVVPGGHGQNRKPRYAEEELYAPEPSAAAALSAPEAPAGHLPTPVRM